MYRYDAAAFQENRIRIWFTFQARNGHDSVAEITGIAGECYHDVATAIRDGAR